MANPNAAFVNILANDSFSNYNAMEMEIRRRFSSGMQFQRTTPGARQWVTLRMRKQPERSGLPADTATGRRLPPLHLGPDAAICRQWPLRPAVRKWPSFLKRRKRSLIGWLEVDYRRYRHVGDWYSMVRRFSSHDVQ